ncbi:MAG: L-histidine N(alpha)-methyltransferase [Deltaproteobacteria bacterium]|nr:L-histidine N(alpha)-methyltransferase [Deltaproteobacteria bacterium]
MIATARRRVPTARPAPSPEMVEVVRRGLTATPRALPPWLFYDARGSALFEDITRLPEYYLTRAEREIFATQGGAILDAAAPDPRTAIVELGAGTASKTRLLLGEQLRRHGAARYVPIDVSASALAIATAELAAELPTLEVEPWASSTEAAMPRLAAMAGPKAVLFIGSSIGNYDHPEAIALLRGVRDAVAAGDTLVLGTDLRKDPAVMVPAYDDRRGVTAAFNLNLLARLNRELDADFDLARFRHVAVWNAARSRIEMHLESVVEQRVHVGALELVVEFAAGERLHTESSVKYDLGLVDEIVGAAGFGRIATFTDGGGRFAVHVARAR